MAPVIIPKSDVCVEKLDGTCTVTTWSLDACSYPKPKELHAKGETIQCFTATSFSTYYKPHTQCSWHISTNESQYVIKVTVEEVTIVYPSNSRHSSCLFDQIIILDGNHIEANSLGHWCGADKHTYITSGQHAYVYFRSDSQMAGKIFKICYVADREETELTNPEKTGTSAIGMFGYVILGWVVLLIALKLSWDRFKKIKEVISEEPGSLEPSRRDIVEPRIDLSIISVSPPPYEQVLDYPHEAPPPYLPRRASQSDVHHQQHCIVFDNFILTRAPPPTYSEARETRNAASGNSIDGQGRSQIDTNTAIRMTNEER